ncbi:MAG: bacteriohemerythrin [Betaproteobacteria bacterium]|nr:bacteriohemerythrin [Rhodocyclales bacterium]
MNVLPFNPEQDLAEAGAGLAAAYLQFPRENVMPILWRDAFSIGFRQIDNDHRHLLDLINAIEAALTVEQAMSKLHNAIDDLAAYTRRHFAFEERLMIEASYVNYEWHKAAHQELIEQLKQAAEPILSMRGGDSNTTLAVPAEARDALVGLLRHWLVDHIIKEDMQLKSVLS